MKKFFASTVLTGLLAFGTGVSAEEVVETVDPGTTPDEFLFTFDQLFEELKLLITFDDEKEAELLLEFANERLAEAAAMSEEEKTEFVQEAFKDYLETLEEAQEKVTEVIVEDGTDSDGEDRLTEELENAANLEEGLTEELENELKEEVAEATEQAKVVANVVKDLDQKMVSQLREQELGYGQIAQIFWLAEAAGKTVEEIAVLYTEEKVGFGQAAKKLGVHPSKMKGLASGKKESSVDEETDTDENAESSEDEGSEEANQAEETNIEEVNQDEGTDTEEGNVEPDSTDQVNTAAASVAGADTRTTASHSIEKKASAEKKAEQAAVKVTEKKAEAEKKAEEQRREAKKKAEEKQKEEVKKAEEKSKEEAKAKAKEETKAKEAKKNKEKQEDEEAEEDEQEDDNSKGNSNKEKNGK
ncbi:hypothetical protein J7E38_11795 [Bacillus sp. ISL-35]|uniref:DUF5667 domain-containing protein n=1 Tax=Bacillus sp. ISL-35 TaxID=2819122 RepID=UPI001BEBF6F1|nr:DUF5667 domain-containing protein [Bacillus sp. ISL-35]MBT2679686.1 hypothetical protein [Bacillus sp. ISL-35]MBT2704719.1 hypothetical protein [Chryseobacterium sp. ISL-80]